MSTNITFVAVQEAIPTAITILINGNQVFSGQVGGAVTPGTKFDLDPISIPIANVGDTVSCSVACTSGIFRFGPVYATNYYTTSGSCFEDMRMADILINGVPPEWPATPVDPMPGGTPENPNWDGWFHELGAGETATVTLGETFDVFQGGSYDVYENNVKIGTQTWNGTEWVYTPV